MVVARGSYMESILKGSPKGSALAKLYETQLKDRPQNLRETIAEVSETIATGGYMSYGGVLAQINVPGAVQYDVEERVFNQAGIALQKGSEFTEAFEHHILKMRQSGLLRQSALKWLPQPKKKLPGCQLTAQRLNLDNLLFVFVMLGGGALLAALSMIAGKLLTSGSIERLSQ